MALDLAGYFERIDYRGAADPTLATLQDLVTAHTRTIPFENLDPLLGHPIDDLSSEALTDKLVHRRRGGYCYEQNGLMGYVLDELGFGGQTPPSPIRLETGGVQQTTREPYRLRTRGDVLLLQNEIRGEWQPLYEFATRTVPAIDLKVGSWYVSTHPSSIFVTSLMVSLIVPDGRCNLDGRNLTYHRDGGTAGRSPRRRDRSCRRPDRTVRHQRGRCRRTRGVRGPYRRASAGCAARAGCVVALLRCRRSVRRRTT